MHLQGYPELEELERKLDADYRRFSKTKSLRFNLAYAEGFEALTTASARFSFESGLVGEMHSEAGQLFSWHLIGGLRTRFGGIRHCGARGWVQKGTQRRA